MKVCQPAFVLFMYTRYFTQARCCIWNSKLRIRNTSQSIIYKNKKPRTTFYIGLFFEMCPNSSQITAKLCFLSYLCLCLRILFKVLQMEMKNSPRQQTEPIIFLSSWALMENTRIRHWMIYSLWSQLNYWEDSWLRQFKRNSVLCAINKYVNLLCRCLY